MICWSKLSPVILKMNALDQWVSLLQAAWLSIEQKNNGALCSDAEMSLACQSQWSYIFWKVDDRLPAPINMQCSDLIYPRRNTFGSFPYLLIFWKNTEKAQQKQDRWCDKINSKRKSGERASGRSKSIPPGKQNRWKDGDLPVSKNAGYIFHQALRINMRQEEGCPRVSHQLAVTAHSSLLPAWSK